MPDSDPDSGSDSGPGIGDLGPEKTALVSAAVVVVAANLLAHSAGMRFPERTVVAVAAGFLALAAVSYALTGRLLPPSDR